VVQRFDGNDDGRIDILESRRAQQARDTSTTFSARANPQQDQSVVQRLAEQEVKEAFLTPDEPYFEPVDVRPDRPVETPDQRGNSADRRSVDLPQQEKVYADLVRDAQIQAGTTEKRFEEARDVQAGLFSNEVETDRKLFGDGVEVVRGRFADDPDVQKKIVDDAEVVVTTAEGEVVQTAVRADATIEQPERGRFYEETTQERKLFDQEEFDNGEVVQGDQPRKVYSELDLYADVAGLNPDNAETVVFDGPASVVRVTA